MSVAVMKTKAELSFAENFGRVQEKLPGSPAVKQARQLAADKFAELGLPHRRIEEWKYTDLRASVKDALPVRVGDETQLTIADVIVALGPLAKLDAHRMVLVNGVYRKELSSPGQLAGLELEDLAGVLSRGTDASAELTSLTARDDDAVLALNTAYMTDGAVARVEAGAQLEKPLLIAHVRAGGEPGFVAQRNAIDIGPKASVQIIEAFVSLPGAAGEGQSNAATQITVGDEANVLHVKCAVDTGEGITHLSNWMVRLGRAADYSGFQLTQGVGLARNQIFAAFDGEDTKLDLSGVFLARGREHIDTTLVVDHAVPSCESRELFKGVLDDQSRGVFQGKIIVQQIAQKTDGKQMSQGLLLSPEAEFDSKPELEIFADDVACGHGATCTELDKDLMFYCGSRGIPQDIARGLLIESFIGEAIEKIEDEPIAGAIMEFARGWLARK